jgi:5-methylcytosine-specific restriction endonuclease McrA
MSQVLLLNTSYEPVAVITHRRALSLLDRDRVVPACDESIELVGVTAVLKIPTVMRLRRYINVPQRGARWSRKAVLQRDDYTCAYCGVRAGSEQRGRVLSRTDMTVDHVLPVSRGGKNNWGNTVCACPACNSRKGGRTPHEANMRLLWEPKTPRVSYLVLSGDVPAVWKVYLEW